MASSCCTSILARSAPIRRGRSQPSETRLPLAPHAPSCASLPGKLPDVSNAIRVDVPKGLEHAHRYIDEPVGNGRRAAELDHGAARWPGAACVNNHVTWANGLI